METGPPTLIERIVAWSIPPAAREHVLGDLRERHISTRQYLVDAIRVVPFVIWSQVHRATDGLLLGLQASALWMVFGPETLWTIYGVVALLRFALPIAAMLTAFVLAQTYARPPQETAENADPALRFDLAMRKSVWAGVMAVCALMLWEAAVRTLNVGPEWILPRRILIRGMLGGFLMTLPMNVAWELLIRSSPQTIGSSADILRQKGQQLLTSRSWMAAWLVLQSAQIGWRLAHSQIQPGLRGVGAAIMMVAGYAAYRVYREFPATSALREAATIDTYRTALEQRTEVMRRAWPWYVTPFLVAHVALALQLALNHPQWWWPPVAEAATSIAFGWLLYAFGGRLTRVLQGQVDALLTPVSDRDPSERAR